MRPMRLLTGLLFAAGRLSSRVSVVLNYAACGTMSLADVKDGIRQSWEGFHSREEDIATGLMDWERDLVARFVRPGEAVLIVGAGSGRDVIPLVERRCHVTGIEPAAVALGLARKVLRARQLPATLIEGFFEDVAVPGRFDVVMFSYYSYSYVPEARRRIAALRKAASCLTAGARVLISYPPLPGPHPLLIRVARATAAICRTDWRLEPGDHVTIQSSAFRGYTHAFADGEIEREAQAAGLDVVYHARYPDPVAALQMRADARSIAAGAGPSASSRRP
jgi:SAM-dependent methyltransferase